MASLWKDEAGFIVSAELVLLATIVVIGMIVGLSSVRDATITALSDVGGSLSNLAQSFRLGGTAGPGSNSMGSAFVDAVDFGDTSATGGANSRCLVIGGTAPEASAS